MKKQIILLLVCLLAAGALGVSLWLLLGYEPDTGSITSPYVDESVLLVDRNSSELETLSVKNENGSFSVRRLEDGTYTLDGMEDAPLSQELLQNIAFAGIRLTALSTVGEDVEDMAAFGLQPAAGSYTASYSDGSSYTLNLGSRAPADSGIYACLPGENTVYLLSLSSASALFYPTLDLMDLAVTVAPQIATTTANSDEEAVFLPNRVVLGGTLRPEELVIEAPEDSSMTDSQYLLSSTYRLVSPKERNIDGDDEINAMGALLTITAQEVIAYNPTEEQLASFGLDEPYSTADFTYYDEQDALRSISLKASAVDSTGSVYLMREGVPVIYRVLASDLPWHSLEYADLITRLQLLPFIHQVKSMTLDFGGGNKTVFELTHETDGNEKLLSVTANGQEVSDEEFRQLYQNVIGIPSENLIDETPPAESTAIFRATFEYIDGSPSDTLALLPSSVARKAFLSINGECEFYTKSSYADTLKNNVEQLLAGETLGFLYG